MMTVKQVSSLTGVSVRTLQFYDEIGLFKPTKVTDVGYRLYDECALERLQQILLFKELDFTLKEIKIVMDNPGFDKTAAFEKQRELIQMKRDRLNTLLELLDKLIKGEKCMDFKDFDMSEYINGLELFKTNNTSDIINHWGSVENFDTFIQKVKDDETKVAKLAIQQFGSIEKYTEAMKYNMEHFSELMDKMPSKEEAGSLIEQTEYLTKKLTSDINKDVKSPEIQKIVGELVSFTDKCNKGIDMGEKYWDFMAENYISSPAFIEVTDKKYGEGASQFIGLALKAYLDRQ